jgi:predicted phosphodiesterase
MERKLILTFIIAIAAGISSCKKLDVGGMFSSSESANERFSQSMEWNATHPYKEIVVPADDYIIFSMSDSHVGGTVNLDTFLSRAAGENAAAIVMAGDLTTGNESDYEMFQQYYQSADSLSLFPMAGNHDEYYNGWDQFYARFGASTYLFTIKTPTATDLFVCLESGGGTLGSDQFEWLKNLLNSERSKYRRCILFTHVNFFRYRHTSSTNPVVEEVNAQIQLFTENSVDVVVAGHDHEKDAEVFGNTTYIVMDALLDGYEQAGYLKLSVNSGSVEYNFINF